ncbi:Oidioi.mRNA.OKI2018_I69.XSR.g15405.t1.cds [Oikopleura dioica]|uniref:Oidioi.mRNA.OKI2018_I69.XSR.g15405.t1.cds n=1 Tax=Oikopleura dioica TaxID=34765 RepID=A0ABN7SCS2_OIKDI|nr:Oidioi.mRNA.OKI2018_I69.XSR.g15405.t1.cds [Oikopleura dioica]
MNNGGSYDIRQDPYYYSQNRAEEHQFLNRQNPQYYSQRHEPAHFHRNEPRFQSSRPAAHQQRIRPPPVPRHTKPASKYSYYPQNAPLYERQIESSPPRSNGMDTIVPPPPPPPSFNRSPHRMHPHQSVYEENYDDGSYLEPRAAMHNFESSSQPPASNSVWIQSQFCYTIG